MRSALLLGLFAAVGTILVGSIYHITKGRIATNERLTLLRSLHEALPKSAYDNDILADKVDVTDDALGTEQPLPVYLARKQGTPVGAILTVVAPVGYNGPIKLQVGIYVDETVADVRVVSHEETLGLGDRNEMTSGNRIVGFTGRSMDNPPMERWAVKRDGGDFDQFSGATTTSRAIVEAVKRSLIYFAAHKNELFSTSELSD